MVESRKIVIFYQQITMPKRGGEFEYKVEHFNSLILNKKDESNILKHRITRLD